MPTSLKPVFIILTLCSVFAAVSSNRENQDPQLGNNASSSAQLPSTKEKKAKRNPLRNVLRFWDESYVDVYDQKALKKDTVFARRALKCEQALALNFDQLCLKLDLEFLGASDEEIDAELAKEAKKIKYTAKKELQGLHKQAAPVIAASKASTLKGKAFCPDATPTRIRRESNFKALSQQK